MIDMVIPAVIVVLILLLASYFYRSNILNRLDDAENIKVKIMKTPIGDEIEATSKIKLNGDSFNKFKEYKGIFEEIKDKKLPSIQKSLAKIKKDVDSFKLLPASADLNDVMQSIKTVNHQLSYIHDGLTQLQDVDNQHHQALEHVDDQLREINQRLLSQNYSFGPSSEKLEDRLQDIKKMYDDFVDNTDNGDQDVASAILNNIYQSIDELNELMDKIPDCYVVLSKEFPKQLDEIERGHRTMLQTGYNFAEDDFSNQIVQLQSSCKHGLTSLANLDVETTQQDSDEIEKSIDAMYALMEQEVVAKRKVKKNMNLIYDFIFHAKNQNRILLEELHALSNNYNLEHDELENAEKLSKEITSIEAIYNRDFQSVSDNSAIFSEVQKHQQDAKHKLSSIEKQQRDINDSVSDLNEEERVARDKIQKYDLELLTIRRQIDNLNLPGLTDDFLERYDYAYQEVSKLASSINQVKISMDEINHRLDNINDTMEEVKNDTHKIIDSAMLAERLMQYANRYRNKNDEIDQACSQAKKYFDKYYQYEKSLSVVAAAIEKVKPGAYKQIEDEYYNEKNS